MFQARVAFLSGVRTIIIYLCIWGISLISTSTGEIIDTTPYLFDNRYYQPYQWSANNRYLVMRSTGFIAVWERDGVSG